MVATDDSESLEALDESDKESCVCCCCCACGGLYLIRETFIFGDGVSDDGDAVDGSLLLLLDDKLLTLLELLWLLPAFKFIRLSFCTLGLTK